MGQKLKGKFSYQSANEEAGKLARCFFQSRNQHVAPPELYRKAAPSSGGYRKELLSNQEWHRSRDLLINKRLTLRHYKFMKQITMDQSYCRICRIISHIYNSCCNKWRRRSVCICSYTLDDNVSKLKWTKRWQKAGQKLKRSSNVLFFFYIPFKFVMFWQSNESCIYIPLEMN